MTNQILLKKDQILLDHGSGGRIASNLIAERMLPLFDNPILSRLDDGATLDINGARLAFSTDSFVVDPIFFPGGDIGDLAVNGTVNDIAMCGGTPLYLSAGLIIEEGFPLADLETILRSMAEAAKKAGVQIVTGDTKVVPKGAADKIFINTAGIGLIPEHVHISGRFARPGDHVIASGPIGDHGVTILAQREGFHFDSPVRSDTAALNHLVARMLSACPDIRVLRDPTRGGVAAVLNEIASASAVGIRIQETAVPLRQSVAGICEMLGFDPLYMANEGKLLAFVDGRHADRLLAAMREDPLGREACVIGRVVDAHPTGVVLETRIGGERVMDMPAGEQLPRIC